MGLVVGTLVLGMVVGFLSWVVTGMRRTEDRFDPRERVRHALTVLRSVLVDAWAYRVTPDGRNLEFSSPGRAGTITFDASKGKLVLRRTDERRPTELVSAGVRSFRFQSLRPGLLRLVVELDRPGRNGSRSSGPLRLYEEVFVPAVGQRCVGIPWKAVLESRI